MADQSVVAVENVPQQVSVAPLEKIQASVSPVEQEKDLAFEKLKEGGIVFYGEEALEKAIERLEEVNLPGGLLPLKDVVESGYVKDTGFVWITQKKPIAHMFRKAGKQVAYGATIKGYLENRRLRDLTGVRAKEMFIWAPIADISIGEETLDKIYFKSTMGLGKLFPVEAFEKGQ
jgi:hypothetical protein